MKPFESYNGKFRLGETLRRFSLSLIFLLSCLGFAHPELDDYVPAVKIRPADSAIANPERQPKRILGGMTQATVAGNHSVFTAVFIHSFVKFDRKQNTRLWPFVTMGTTRAPPRQFPYNS